MKQKDYQKIIVEQQESVVTIAMNAPKTLNAFDEILLDEMLEALETCQMDSSCRVVVIKGTGKAFSAGGDIAAMNEFLSTDITAFFKPVLQRVNKLALAIRAIPKPVVASVHGAAAGAGFNLALCCDFIMAADNARFVQAFVNIGLIPDMGGTYFLSRALPPAKVMEYTMLGDIISAEDLYSLGMVNYLTEPEELEKQTLELAKKLASKPRESLSTSKAMVNKINYPDLEEILNAEYDAQIYLAKQPDFAEGIASFIEKRKPNF